MKNIRCAIYTRKSSEEGLEQDFNSLDAQHAACAAYIASQAGEGWTLIKTRYDDGGISGGTLERPRLKALLADIAAGLIDIVVVYKVDRLTRSLLDFAKLVEAFDKAGASFVSVTQSFNTTNSVGRLTLNMLLSFAQFEREVTAERIRDKIAASKQRGMWMGGTPPIGYRPDGRTLAIVEEDAALIRHIFRRYLALGTVSALHDELISKGVQQPLRTSSTGRPFGGKPFHRGQLYDILNNELYLGRIRHGTKTYPGKHAAIIDRHLWDQVQAQLKANTQGERIGLTIKDVSLLAGKLLGPEGEPLAAVHANKGKVRYRYYVSRHLQHGTRQAQRTTDGSADGVRIPAKEIEQLVIKALTEKLSDPIAFGQQLGLPFQQPALANRIATNAARLVSTLRGKRSRGVQAVLAQVIQQVRVLDECIEILLNVTDVASALGANLEQPNTSDSQDAIAISLPVRIKRSGMAVKLVQETGIPANWDKVDTKLLTAMAKAPSIVQDVLNGSAPADFNLDRLKDVKRITPSWAAQRQNFGFTAGRG